VRNATPPGAPVRFDHAMAVLAEKQATPEEPTRLSEAHRDYAIKTWRYLRLSMVALVVGLLVAVGYEWQAVPHHCFQTSISAYFYTPVRGYFVGALLSIGTCLFCLKGSQPREDLLMNLAGICAAVVALVPTPDAGTCTSLPGTTDDRAPDIANNVTVLVAIGLFAVVVLATLWLATPHRPRPRPRAMYVVGALLWLPVAVLFEANRDAFMGSAHDIAAYAMFLFIVGVVGLNALATRAPRPRKAYAAVFAAMVASAVVIIAARLLGGWSHWVIGIETAFIVLFAAFWAIQTAELWDDGLRPG
jgi:hypothetical protein